MFDIVFLGTSASAPSIYRGLSAQVVMVRDHRFLIDCGEGTQRQILKSGIGFKRLNRILITHGHLDHILGLAGMLSTFMRWEAIDEMEIWGSRHALNRVHDLLYGVVLMGRRPPMPIHLIDLEPGVLLEDDYFTLSAFRVTHRGADAFGFAFEEKARRPFLNEKAEALGVPVGPERRLLVAGEPITLAHGTVVHPDQVLGPAVRGARLVHVGDCGRTDDIQDFVADADCLVIEATYLDVEADMARQFGHLTAAQAARLARDAGVRQLILTHVSRRYRERDIREEARAVFPDTEVARDFDRFTVLKHQPVRKVPTPGRALPQPEEVEEAEETPES